jgi:trk system potassium uptake protein TrkA
VRSYVGHGAIPTFWPQAGADQADMIIAVTLYDEINMVACQVAHSIFNVPTKIARIRAQSYLKSHWSDLFSRDHMPIDVIISPEARWDRWCCAGSRAGRHRYRAFADDKVAMVAIECLEDCPVVNTPLVQLSELFPDLRRPWSASGATSGCSCRIPADQLETGDLAYVVCDREQVRRTLGLFGHDEAGGAAASSSRAAAISVSTSPQPDRGTAAQDQGQDHRGRP